MALPKNQPNASSAKPANDAKEKRDWLTLHVLLPIENNYRVLMTPGNIDFWCEFFGGWTRGQILQTFQVVIRECQRPPTAADWTRLKVNPDKSKPEFLDETPDQTLERLAETATGWGKIVATITRWGLKSRDANGDNRMPEAYDKLMAKAHEFGYHDDARKFLEAKQIVLRFRENRHKRSPLRGRPKNSLTQAGRQP